MYLFDDWLAFDFLLYKIFQDPPVSQSINIKCRDQEKSMLSHLIFINIYISKSTCEFYGFILRINRSIEYSNKYFIHKKYIPWTATQWPTARKSSWSASSARSCPQIWKRPWCLHCRCILYMYLKKGLWMTRLPVAMVSSLANN